MTAMPIPFDLPLDRHGAAQAEAYAWRGRCIDRFAKTERRIGELLLEASKQPGANDTAGFMPWLVGHKYQRLLDMQQKSGPLQDKHLQARLEAMAPFHELRAVLCHGEMTVGLLADGNWQIGLEILCCEQGRAVLRSMSLTKPQAEGLAARHLSTANALGAAMGQVRKRLAPGGVVIALQPAAVPL